MKVLILGSNGFLSDSLCRYFISQQDVELSVWGKEPPHFDHSIKFVQTDFLEENINYEELIGSDIIIYATAAGVQSNMNVPVDDIYALNCFFPIQICNYLNKSSFNGVFISFGTYFEIGYNDDNKAFTEDEVACSLRVVPNDYCISKRLLTRYFISAIHHFSFKALHLILPTIYGEHEPCHRLIPYVVRSIQQKQVLQFTDGNQIRQYLYVGDLVKIIQNLIINREKGVFNVPGSETVSVKDVVFNILDYYGIPVTKANFGGTERYDVGMKNLQLCDEKIRKVIEYVPVTHILDICNKYSF